VAQSGGTDINCLAGEEVMLQGGLYGLGKTRCRERTAFLLDRLDLAGLAERRVRTLSGGQRRRLDIAIGIVHEPPVLFLDEPSAGLDPQSRQNLWEHLRWLRQEAGTTIFLTTHYLDEADALCDRILVIDHGRIVAEDTPEGLKQQISGDVVTVVLEGDPEVARPLLAGLPGVRDVTALGATTLRLTTDHSDQTVVDLITTLRNAGVSVAGLELTRPSLEDVFLTLTGSSLRDGSG
jgi:ABC-2 type transport system ATP-binding protein